MSEIADFANFEEQLRQVLSPYKFVETSEIKPLKKVVTQKDLERQCKLIVDALVDKSKFKFLADSAFRK